MTSSNTGIAGSMSVAGPFRALCAAARYLLRLTRREAEIRKTQRHLDRLSPETLRDIGMDQTEIRSLTRIGRNEYGRRYL